MTKLDKIVMKNIPKMHRVLIITIYLYIRSLVIIPSFLDTGILTFLNFGTISCEPDHDAQSEGAMQTSKLPFHQLEHNVEHQLLATSL